MTDNQQRAFECWADSDPVSAIATALDAAETRGRAERDEQTGRFVAALVARAELAEATTRRLVETLARLEYVTDPACPLSRRAGGRAGDCGDCGHARGAHINDAMCLGHCDCEGFETP